MEGEEGRGGREEAVVVPEILACLPCAAAAATHETTSRTAAHGLRPRAIGAPLRRAAARVDRTKSTARELERRAAARRLLPRAGEALLLFTSAGCLCCAVGYRCQGAAGIKVRRLGGRVVNGRRV
jgi:hypothetical protein